jgi:hypothetical protein
MEDRTMTPGWIWCEPDGTIVGVASDGQVVQLGTCLVRKPSRKPGYPIIPADVHTMEYLKSHPTPDQW